MAFLAACILLGQAPRAGEDAAHLWQLRNLGKAFYENPTTQKQAVDTFRQAVALAPDSPRERLNYGLALLRAGDTAAGTSELEKVQRQDPTLPHTWFNLGIAYKRQGDFDKAFGQFRGFLRLVPSEPVAHYQLGTLYKMKGDTGAAIKEFETARDLNPRLAAPHFQLYGLYRQEGKPDAAARELQIFQMLKKEQEGAAVPEDMEWCSYAEIYDPEPPPAAPLSTPVYRDEKIADGFTGPDSGVAVLLLDGAGHWTPSLIAWGGGRAVLFRDGKTTVPHWGLEDLRDVVSIAPGDFDNDGLPDLCVITRSGAALYRNLGGGQFRKQADLASGSYRKAVWTDFDHDYDEDLILLGDSGPHLFRNKGSAGFSAAGLLDHFPAVNDRSAEADFDGHGRAARVRIAADGSLQIEHDVTPEYGNWTEVALTGVKNVKLALDATVEVKAGTFYQRAIYKAVPLIFRLGPRTSIDTVRITWPNGLIQNEISQPVNRVLAIKEAPRLSGSCPMIFTWDGTRFRFITDVLGVAPLGASSGDGEYFPTNHREYVSIPAGALQPRDGEYEIRMTEELREVSYLDQIKLIAVDHPAATEIATNDKFKSPPYPEFRLFDVAHKIHPVKTVAPAFRRDMAGVAEMHNLDLDFGNAAPDNRALLVLHGWVDWADGSTFLGAEQSGRDLVFPYLQVKDAAGHWKTVIDDMGMPSGKPKTIVVDLTGRFLSPSREIRIVTNLCVYWDDIGLVEGDAPPVVRMTDVPLAGADLHFRGFSKVTIDPARRQPEKFDYQTVAFTSMWNPTPGDYTRYGAVEELLQNIDDRMIVMGSGDEVAMHFGAADLPALPAGWKRDFLLAVDGWAKDGDANTAFHDSVLPLPFHAMSRYPYPANETYPQDRAHAEYIREYLTRPALRLIRPLGGD